MYLKGTLNHGILLERSDSLTLVGFIDFGWTSCPNNHKSNGGFTVYFDDNMVS